MWISPVKRARMPWTLLLGILASLPPAQIYAQSPGAQSVQTDARHDASPSANATEIKGLAPETPKPGTSVARTTVARTPEELRRAQLAADTKRLYELAIELRAEVAKTNKDTLSLTVVNKTEEVEKLAKSLKTRMAAEAASSKH